MPAATSAACTIAVTDPLPLVPATCSERKDRCGWPSASQSSRMFSSPSLMPKVSSAKSLFSSDGYLFNGRGDLRAHEAERARDRRLHLAAIDDEIEHAVLEQELAALEAFRQLLTDGLLDDARPRESDQRFRLRDVQVAEHREARGHAARRRVGQQRDERQPRAIEPGGRRRD